MSLRTPPRLKSSENRVVVIEPQCWGLEHAPFNAALVTMAAAMWPDAIVETVGEASHLAAVRELIADARVATLDRIEWQPATIAPRRSSGRERWAATIGLFSWLRARFRGAMPRALFLASADPQVIALLKMHLHTRWRGVPTFAVFHELLAVLNGRRRSWKRFGFRTAVRMPHPPTLRYLVLGTSIHERLWRIDPSLAATTMAIDHPSLIGDLSYGGRVSESVPPLKFGFIGGGRNGKGFGEFVELAEAVHRDHPTIPFEVVGSVKGAPRSNDPNLHWSEEKLPFPEFVSRLRGLSHVIWLGNPRHYDLVASGSLADAVALGIPVICQSGPFVDHFFERFGDIGVKGDTKEEIRRQVGNLIAGFDAGEYRKQKQALERAKQLLAPEAAAGALLSGLPVSGKSNAASRGGRLRRQ
jgi:hypothetical protein